ncbi:TolC family protein [Paraglaciecola polaris]|uniref:TolC family protein n=1 Tax=Paraglaciecola polaris TaxID=222814 RepID=UPI0030EDDD86
MILANVKSRVPSALSIAVCSVLTCSILVLSPQSRAMSLQQAVLQAQQHDPWLTGSDEKEHALTAQGAAADTLPNPEFSLGMLNVPSDGFAFNQEPMTQFKLGVKQMFTRGDSRAITRQHFDELAAQQPLLRQDRLAQVKLNVTLLWLDLYTAKQGVGLSIKQRDLLEQLIDIAQTHYAAVYTSGQKNLTQNDVLAAQLTLARLDDRIAELRTRQGTALANLCQWLLKEPDNNKHDPSVVIAARFEECDVDDTTGSTLPRLMPLPMLASVDRIDRHAIAQLLSQHPRMKALNQGIAASDSDVQLAKSQYAPQWGVNASYAYRQDDDANRSRADFWSVGISVDVPIFSSVKQDNLLAASHHQKEALRTDYRLQLREMLAQVDSLHGQYRSYTRRIAHYEQVILGNIAAQKQVSMANLSHDYGSLSQATEVAIIELDARLEQLNLMNKQQRTQAKIQYFLPAQNQNINVSSQSDTFKAGSPSFKGVMSTEQVSAQPSEINQERHP